MATRIRVLPDLLKSEQQHRMGITSPDEWGRNWSYVGFVPATYAKGVVVRDHLSPDLITNDGIGTPTAASATGTYTLEDTGEFASDDFYGAIGHIHDGAGQGQRFIVHGRDKEGNKLYITMMDGSGWEVGIDTTSRYSLYLPGLVLISTGVHQFQRGAIQREAFTVPANERWYGWVLKDGDGVGLLDNSGTAIPDDNGRLAPTTAGKLIGSTALNGTVGKAPLPNPSETTDDFLIPVEFDIPNKALSYRYELDKQQPMRNIQIGGMIGR